MLFQQSCSNELKVSMAIVVSIHKFVSLEKLHGDMKSQMTPKKRIYCSSPPN